MTTAHEYADGLRRLADFIEGHPETHPNINSINAWYPTKAEQLGLIARCAARAGYEVDKDISDSMYNLNIHFGPVLVKALAMRHEVCQRVQVGTETVTKRVPAPDAPEVEVTEEQPLYEWRCSPLLEGAS